MHSRLGLNAFIETYLYEGYSNLLEIITQISMQTI